MLLIAPRAEGAQSNFVVMQMTLTIKTKKKKKDLICFHQIHDYLSSPYSLGLQWCSGWSPCSNSRVTPTPSSSFQRTGSQRT